MWSASENDRLLEVFGAVCEATGAQFSATALDLMLEQLKPYPALAVARALKRCLRECRSRLLLADILERIDDTRPGVEQAWASMAKDEADSCLATEEMLAAWGVAAPLYYAGDAVGARMAFKEVYERTLRAARADSKPARWILSAGFNAGAREAVAVDGMRRGLLAPPLALQYIAPEKQRQALLDAGIEAHPLLALPAENPAALAKLRGELATIAKPILQATPP
jgi:hypothetical protein